MNYGLYLDLYELWTLLLYFSEERLPMYQEKKNHIIHE